MFFSPLLPEPQAGAKAAKEIVEKLINKLYIEVVDLQSEGLESDSLLEEKIREVLGG